MIQNGLVLEGGGMRGVFTAGVLDVFLEEGIRFDLVSGVSAGACHACSYIAEQKGRAFATAVNYIKDKNYCSLYSLVKTGDLFGADFLYRKIPLELYPIDNETYRKSSTQFHAVMTNCITGEAEYPLVEDLIRDIEYVRASASLPLAARMVMINGVPYLDGGLSDSVPIKHSIACGANKNVVVLTRQKGYNKGKIELLPIIKARYRAFPLLVQSMVNRAKVYNETLQFIEQEEQAGRVFVIRPPFALDVSKTEKNVKKLSEAYVIGCRTATDRIGELKQYLYGTGNS